MKSVATIFAFALILAGCSNDEKPTADTVQPAADTSAQAADNARAAAAKQAEEFKTLFNQELKQIKPKWQNVEFLDSEPNHYRFAINYKESANISGYDEVAKDTTIVARAALKSLMAMGYTPAKNQTTIRVHAYQSAGTGETGTPLTRKLGRASYDYNSDQITFELPQ